MHLEAESAVSKVVEGVIKMINDFKGAKNLTHNSSQPDTFSPSLFFAYYTFVYTYFQQVKKKCTHTFR